MKIKDVAIGDQFVLDYDTYIKTNSMKVLGRPYRSKEIGCVCTQSTTFENGNLYYFDEDIEVEPVIVATEDERKQELWDTVKAMIELMLKESKGDEDDN